MNTFFNPKQIVFVCSLVCLSASAQRAEFVDPFSQPIEWLSPIDSVWSGLANWTDRDVPNTRQEDAIINVPGEYSITVNSSFNIGSLFLTNPDVTLMIDSPVIFTVYEDFVNHATILLNPNGLESNARLRVAQNTTLFPPGEILMNAENEPFDAQLLTIFGSTLTIAPGYSIRGAGHFGGTFVNHGEFIAQDLNGVGMRFFGSMTQENGGIIRATGTKLIFEENATLVGGEIRLDPNSILTLRGATDLRPDVITMEVGSRIRIEGTSGFVFPGQLIEAIDVYGEQSLYILNEDLQNDGVVTINADRNPVSSRIRIDTSCSITGNGVIRMLLNEADPNVNTTSIFTNGQVELTLSPDLLVEGAGQIESSSGQIINQGIIRGNHPTKEMVLRGTHSGGGLYEADGADMAFSSMVLNSGILSTKNNGRIIPLGATFNDVTINGDVFVGLDNAELRLGGNTANNGKILIHAIGINDQVELIGQADTVVTGSGEIELRTTGLGGRPEIDGWFTFGPNQSIYGSGRINAEIYLQSKIIANDPLHPLLIISSLINGGECIAQDATIELGNVQLVNTSVYPTGSGRVKSSIFQNGEIRLNNVLLVSDLDIFNNVALVIQGPVELHGDHLFLDEGRIEFEGSSTLDGSGTITMRTQVAKRNEPAIVVQSNADGVIGKDYIVQGSGLIAGYGQCTLTNQGLFIANDPFAPLRYLGNLRGNGVYRADNAIMELSNTANFDGGIFEAIGSGFIEVGVGTASIGNLINHGIIKLPGHDSNLDLVTDIENNGTIVINSNLQSDGARLHARVPLEISGVGTIEMHRVESENDARLHADDPLTIGQFQTIIGDGRLVGSGGIIINGKVDPGGNTREFVTAKMRFSETTRIHLDIGGVETGTYDRFTVLTSNLVELDGTLNIELEKGYLPSIGDSWTIIDGGNITGEFAQVMVPIVPEGQIYRVLYSSNETTVVLTCLADYNGDGALNFFDITHFLVLYLENDIEADLNNSGSLNFLDISLFLQAFSDGCS